MKSHRACLVLLALSLSSHAATTNQSLVATRSASGQFTAYAPNPLFASGLCAFAETIKRQWRFQLDEPDAWHNLIVFVVRERAAGAKDVPALSSQLFQIDDRLKWQITCVVPPPIDDANLAAAIVEALCADSAERDLPRRRAGRSTPVPVPLWLTEGLAQNIIGQPDQLLVAIRQTAARERPLRALEIMQTQVLPADAAGRAVFRANAALLIESLLRLPDGTRRIRQLLSQLGEKRHFGQAFAAVYGDELPDEVTLEKWWSLNLAHRADANLAELLSATETARRLDSLLQFGTDIPFNQLWRTYRNSKTVLRERVAGLQMLRLRAHPLYRPVIGRYADALRELLNSEPARFRRVASAAARQRAEVEQRLHQIREVLDRVESTQSPE